MIRIPTCAPCLLTIILTTVAMSTSSAQEPSPVKKSPGAPSLETRPTRVQMAILLDTSSSMNGLIHQAKTQLWQVVNELATAKRGGRPVDFELAFYEYGKNTIPQREQYVRKILPLTTNLDEVSKQLHALGTAPRAGGDEWPGAAIRRAVRELAWSPSGDDLKIIFVAGNEAFSQGPVDYHVSCKEAITRGIIVNTVHCGDHATGISQGWKDGSRLADGSYTSIDQNRAVSQAAAPQDAEIRKLNTALNGTYVPFGARGRQGLELQSGQDRNAEEARDGSIVERARTKSSLLYRNATWDLVDALEQDKVDLEKLDREKLPPALQKLTTQERKAYLKGKAAERRKLKQRIQNLYDERAAHFERVRSAAVPRSTANRAETSGTPGPRGKAKPADASERKNARRPATAGAPRPQNAPIAEAAGSARAANETKDLGSAVVETLKAQAAKKNIRIGEPKKPENKAGPPKIDPKTSDPQPQAGKQAPSSTDSKGSTGP